jgi:Protein of unknown function (DUF1553)/Protein of unknown function (DUF1549)/Planctomycete cytochrome C
MNAGWIAWTLVAAAGVAAPPADVAFFEAKIRPVLISHCYRCHSGEAKGGVRGQLNLETRAGLLRGGRSGPALVPGKPDESALMRALGYADQDLQMPPDGKLPDATLADFRSWIAAGAPDPRVGPGARALARVSVEEGRKWWAFQPVRTAEAPELTAPGWPKTKVDSFLLEGLRDRRLAPSPPADRRSLVIRAYLDLVGYRPTYQEVTAFLADRSPRAWERLVDRLLASPRYGERWGRHWMDVARYGEDNPTTEATNPPYPYAWRYRDWIIEAMNADVPYDRFVGLQLAADLMPGTSRQDLRALGFLGAAPVYHKDQRLSAAVIGGFLTDDWDDRIDTVTRGVLGLSVACARCHDHKFDPIPQRDYYGLMGVFASTTRGERPLFDVEPELELRYLEMQRRLCDLSYSVRMAINESSTFTGVEEKLARWKAEIAALETEATERFARYPPLVKSLASFWEPPPEKGAGPVAAADDAADAPVQARAAGPRRRRPMPRGSTEPFTNAVFEAAQLIDASDPTYTFLVYQAGVPRDVPIMHAGNYAAPGEVVPRHFPVVLAHGDGGLAHGSGRLELAERIFADAGALAARVIVNRVWGWHFGRGLVETASDFGTQGDRPTHPALLDDLAARFVQSRWSLKWLHREIMLSAAYQQSSRPRADAGQADETNALLWRMNPRRLDIEAYRDSLLRAGGLLDETMGGPSGDLDSETFHRRSVYGRVSRSRTSKLLGIYDFPSAVQTAPGRELTTTTLQQIFVMNSPLVHDIAVAAATRAQRETSPPARVRSLYRLILSRNPTAAELTAGLAHVKTASLERHAQVLLSTNEEIFQP